MPEIRFRLEVPDSPQTVWDWHMHPGAFARLVPPWDPLEVLEWEGIHDGARQVFQLRALGVRQTWIAVIDRFEPPHVFRDSSLKGPFAEWRHTHTMEPTAQGGTVVDDHIVYRLPLGGLGQAVGGGFALGKVRRGWAWRHHRTRWDLDRHRPFREQGPKVFAITGATGFVGRSLCAMLTTGGHEVRRVVRRGTGADDEILWSPARGELQADKLEGVDAVIHLAGSPIAVRWTPETMGMIRDSRVQGTDLLARALAGMQRKPSVFVSGSAVGFYGYQDGAEPKPEDAPLGDGFAASVCSDWEAAAAPAQDAGIRTVFSRTGVVLRPDGGALAQMLPAFRAGTGGPIGGGEQYFPWITLDDMTGALHHMAFTEALEGPVNAVSPGVCSQRSFASALGSALSRPAFVPAPAFVLRAAMGQMAEELVLGGQNVVPQKLLDSGFAFEAPQVREALDRVLGGPEVQPV